MNNVVPSEKSAAKVGEPIIEYNSTCEIFLQPVKAVSSIPLQFFPILIVVRLVHPLKALLSIVFIESSEISSIFRSH